MKPAAFIAHESALRCDLHWRSNSIGPDGTAIRIDLEYQGLDYRSSNDGIVDDSLRKNALEIVGCAVVYLTKGELPSPYTFKLCALSIKRRLGARRRVTVKDFERKQRCL